MPYRPIPVLHPPTEADIDDPEMAESAVVVARGEEDLAMLSRLAQIGMELAEAQGAYARTRLAAASGEDAALKPGEDPTGAFNKIAQTVRRIIALKSKIAEDLERRRAGLGVERGRGRAERAEDHRRAVVVEIDDALTEAFTETYGDGDAETDEGDRLCQEMLNDKEDLLGDLDAFGDYLDRPVGETIARLCVELGLDPNTCVNDGKAWRIKRPPSAWQAFRNMRDGVEAVRSVTSAVRSP